jgi:hypothetical protein
VAQSAGELFIWLHNRHDEEPGLVKSPSPTLLPLFILSIDTGLRANEARHLRHRDLNIEWQDGVIRSGILRVSRSKTEGGLAVPFR